MQNEAFVKWNIPLGLLYQSLEYPKQAWWKLAVMQLWIITVFTDHYTSLLVTWSSSLQIVCYLLLSPVLNIRLSHFYGFWWFNSQYCINKHCCACHQTHLKVKHGSFWDECQDEINPKGVSILCRFNQQRINLLLYFAIFFSLTGDDKRLCLCKTMVGIQYYCRNGVLES